MRKTFFIIVPLLFLYVFLNRVFSGSLILPQAFHFGSLTIRYYGLIMASSVAIGWYLAKKRAIKLKINEKSAEDIIFWLIVGGFIGARLYHVLSSLDYYRYHFIDVVKVWHGGLSIYGALLGGLAVILFFSKSYSLNATRLLDWLTPSIILGQIIGRFGNLFNYEALGYPINLPWKMFVPQAFRPLGYESFNFFHPWFLYEQLGLVVIFLIIRRLEKRNTPSLFVWYFLLYNTLRFGLEFLRIDSVLHYGLRQNAVVSLILGFISFLIIISSLRINAQQA